MIEQSTCARVLLGEGSGRREVLLERGYAWKIGRSAACEIVVSDARVSRQHAVIQRTETADYYLVDLGSRNGSFVNESRVSTPVILRHTDRISVGGFPVLFQNESAGERSLAGISDESATQAWFARYPVTVLVVDLRNFTQLARQLDEPVLCQAIGTWFRLASEIMQRHGCWTLKYIGDAVMAIWLHREPSTAGADVRRALEALAEFARATVEVGAALPLPDSLRIGAGVNTGPASVGNTGTASFTDYTAMGDAVNAAFRIEAATKEIGLGVALGNATYEALPKGASPERYFRPQAVMLKGYETPNRIWAASFESLSEFLAQSEPGRPGALTTGEGPQG